MTPTGQRRLVQVRSLPLEEQEKYKPHATYGSMPIPLIQSHVYNWQKNESEKSFSALYKNFMPLMNNTIKRVVGGRNVSKEDVEDLKMEANRIFVRALSNVDHTDQGVIKYLKQSLQKQLEGKSRDIFRTTVTIGPKDRRLLRAVHKYIHEYYGKHGTEPTDYDQMARDLNKDKTNKVDNADARKIQSLLETGAVSLHKPIEHDDSASSLADVLQPAEEDITRMQTQEEDLAIKRLKEAIKEGLSKLPEEQRKVIELKYRFDEEEQQGGKLEKSPERTIKEISKILGLPRTTTKRELDRAEAKLRRMKEMQQLSSTVRRIIKAFNKHVKFAYDAKTVKKISKTSYIIDNKFTVSKYANQYVCDCDVDNCLHTDVIRDLQKNGK